MKRTLLFILLLIFFSSCKDEDTILIDGSASSTKCQFSVHVSHCIDYACVYKLPVQQIKVELYNSLEAAQAGENELQNKITDTDGNVHFDELECEQIYVRVSNDENGTYIKACHVETDHPFSIQFVNGYFYNDDNNLEIIQQNISFQQPRVGQQSRYQYYFDNFNLNFQPLEYADNFLTVSIIDQLDESSYLVEESIDSIIGFLGVPFYPPTETVRNIWQFEQDSIFIFPYNEEYFSSFVWNLSEIFENEENGYGFSLSQPTINPINMDNDTYNNLNYHGTGFAENYILFGQIHEDLITHKISYNAWDGPIKFRAYNLNNGLIRSMDFFAGGYPAAHGFDLVID